jgi:hypothetical protein
LVKPLLGSIYGFYVKTGLIDTPCPL